MTRRTRMENQVHGIHDQAPEQRSDAMDIIDRHFAAENAHDVEATLATYSDDIVWDDVTHPEAPFHGKEAVGKVYASIIDAIPDVELTSVKRFTGEGGRYAVDESIITENAWFDAAAVQRQILAWRDREASRAAR